MIYLHDSVKTDFFKNDKKLQLLQNGIITISQFANLIEPKDEYVLIGPAVVAKTKINDFILEWKSRDLNLETAVNRKSVMMISQDEFIEKLGELKKVFPEIIDTVGEFKAQMKITSCPKCVKNRYLSAIALKIKSLKDDGRDVSSVAEFIELIMEKYFPGIRNKSELLSKFDVEWLKPEEMVGLGKDLIPNLSNCFNCTLKHISRAKILYEEFLTGYPDHKPLMFNELTESNKDLEQAYIIYMDSMSQLDMASCELVGDMLDLPDGWQVEMIELANKIRAARLMFQDDPTKVPDFDGLRLEVKKLQIKTEQAIKTSRKENVFKVIN